MKLIVGLGNPGVSYDKTRHNVGFMVIDNFASYNNVSISKEKFNGLYCEMFVGDEKVILLKPCSYMNLSGEVVSKFVSYFNIDVSDILVICDDLALDMFRFRLRLFGSCGGHNGLRNIEKMLGTDKFKRFRIGIGNSNDIDTKDFVLSKFSSLEYDNFKDILPKSVDVLNDFCSFNFDKVMSKYNG